MKITVVFDSLEEFRQHFGTTCAPAEPVKVWGPEEPREDAAHVSGMCPITIQEPEEKPKEQEKPAEKPQEPKKAPDLPFTEDKKVTVEEVRKTLAALNKKAGKNIAKELIASVGYKKLTEVPEGALVTLQSLIEEEEKNYA